MKVDLKFGDCLEVMKEIPDKSIDAIICDPPYGTTSCAWDAIIPFEPMWEHYKRLIKEDGPIVLFGSQPFSSLLVVSNLPMFKYELIWDKNKAGNIMLANKRPLKVHENILVFGGSTYNAQKTPVYGRIRDERETHKNYENRTDGVVTPKGKVKYSDEYDPSKRCPVSIQRFGNHREKDDVNHPTEKPIKLMEFLIKTYTNEGDTVLDNSMGSGTTGVACIRTNRNFIGIEKDEKYFKAAEGRVEAERKEKSWDLF